MTADFSIDFEPLGRRSSAKGGQNILQAAQSAGVGLASICGGAGTCEECRIRIVSGKVTPPTLVEEAVLLPGELTTGIRLACQTFPLTDLKIDIPPESLTTPQRLQVEGQDTWVAPDLPERPPGAFGLAVDIGTTKLAAYLVRLDTGETVARGGAMNPQIGYGEDVISRIAYTGREPQGAHTLHKVLFEALNGLLGQLCGEAAISSKQVQEAVLVGNTAMHHLAVNLPVEQLGRAPFSPATTDPLEVEAVKLGLALADGAKVYFPPVIAGYVGSDHIAMLLATGALHSRHNLIALDIGTNTEISLVVSGKAMCCSCASGPAFEGAHISEGMRAAPGAIERARWSSGEIQWQTIENRPPVGICGSGILDVVAALQNGQVIRPTGALVDRQSIGYTLVPAAQSGVSRDLVVTRKDIHEIQLAKSAIRSGVETLLRLAGLGYNDLDEFIVAGAFGTYLDLKSAVRVGMFPPLPVGRFRQVGNAAGVGARQMLVSHRKRLEAETIARQLTYVELTTRPEFTDLFIKNLPLEV